MLPSGSRSDLEAVGARLFEAVFHEKDVGGLFQNFFKAAHAENVSSILHLIFEESAAEMIRLPWELLYDGQDFLGLRFAIGRIVSTKQKVAASRTRRVGHPLRMLVLADPRSDLPASGEEGRQLRTQLDAFSQDIISGGKQQRSHSLVVECRSAAGSMPEHHVTVLHHRVDQLQNRTALFTGRLPIRTVPDALVQRNHRIQVASLCVQLIPSVPQWM